METYTNTGDVFINKPSTVDWSKFEFTNGYTPHVISEKEIYKPYLISILYYDDDVYEDVILLINNIASVFDLRPGAKLKIPDYKDLKDFLSDNSK